MTSIEGTDSIELECETLFSSKNKDIHSSTLKSTSDENGEFRPRYYCKYVDYFVSRKNVLVVDNGMVVCHSIEMSSDIRLEVFT